ncbi:MAG: dienelactone hydrolase family protein [Novosphingobium sp.]
MCDEFTSAAEDEALARKGLSRRQFAAIGAGAVLAACSGAGEGASRGLVEKMVQVPTPDGMADAFFVHPRRGRHPAVIMWPDIVGLRDAFKAMARRLAESGFSVLAVNHYYRTARAPVLTSFAEWRTPEGQAKMRPAIAALTSETTARDTAAFAAFLDRQPSVNRQRKIGVQGYCQTGSFAIRSAAAVPDRIGAVASFHGGGLVSAAADSPHQLFARTMASFLIAIARNDDERAPGDKDALRQAASASGRPVEVVVYPADHGWCVLDSPVYDKEQADLAWEQLTGLYLGAL